MPRFLTIWNNELLNRPVLEPRWLIRINDLRLSTLYHTIYQRETYAQANVSVGFSGEWVCNLAITDVRDLYQRRIRRGDPMSLLMLYGNEGFQDQDANLFWSGVVHTRSVRNDVISLVGRLGGVRLFPSAIANSQTGFNHLLPHGAKVVMPDGVYQFEE